MKSVLMLLKQMVAPYVAVLLEPVPPQANEAGGKGGRLLAIAALCGVMLTLNHSFATQRTFNSLFSEWTVAGELRLGVYLYWVSFLAVTSVAVPAIFSWRFLGLSPADLGVGIGESRSCWRAYVLLYLVNLPLIFAASRMPVFVTYYPFYKGAGESLAAFVGWEALYGVQFFCVEFFYRGFMVHTARRVIGGGGAVAFMMLPYCMMHFPKPFPEPLVALVMGFVLGVLSLRSGSIWGGVAVHVCVAATMDLLALACQPGP